MMLTPEWTPPPGVRAAHSLAGIVPSTLRATLGLPAEPCWLEQVHGHTVVHPRPGETGLMGDAAVTRAPGTVLAVRTADCLPVLLASRDGRCIAAAHAGWRGLAAGVLEAVVEAMDTAPGEIMAWLGPAIGQDAFEVGPEVRAAFLAVDPAANAAFRPGRDDRWHADLVALACRRLAALGVDDISGGRWCTFSDPGRFHSFRRGDREERMASLIWMEA